MAAAIWRSLNPSSSSRNTSRILRTGNLKQCDHCRTSGDASSGIELAQDAAQIQFRRASRLQPAVKQ
jgi:hypothetical protein